MEKKIRRDDALQALLDKQEIYEALMRYCRAVDRCDEQLLRSVYHPDAIDDHGVFKGKASDFVDFAMAALEPIKLTSHSVSNVLIEVEGDTAYSEAYVTAFHRIEKEGKDYDVILGGRYIDRFERRNGVWKIAQRRLVFEWTRNDVSTEELGTGSIVGGLKGDFLIGLRGPEDIVYQR
jgi:ketosteroid isomerase-like protein